MCTLGLSTSRCVVRVLGNESSSRMRPQQGFGGRQATAVRRQKARHKGVSGRHVLCAHVAARQHEGPLELHRKIKEKHERAPLLVGDE